MPGWTSVPDPLVAIDARFVRYAQLDEKGAISVRQVADGLVVAEFVAPDGIATGDMILSPDGRYLAACYQTGNELKIWDIDQKKSYSLKQTYSTRYSALTASAPSLVCLWNLSLWKRQPVR